MVLFNLLHFTTVVTVLLVANKSVTNGDIISVRAGNAVVLPCEVQPPRAETPGYVIEWSRSGNALPIYYKVGKYPARINNQFRGRVSLLKNSASLQIRSARISDDGWYECRILYVGNSESSDNGMEGNGTWSKLVVTAQPFLTSAPPPTIIAKEKDSMKLRCSMGGKPEPEITWRKDGWLLTNGKNGVIVKGEELFVKSLKKSHRGDYECRGQNSDGQVEHITKVYVKAPPEMVVLPKNLTLKGAVDAIFTCKARGYPNNITYRWYYNHLPVDSVTSLIRRYDVRSDGTFVIYSVNRRDSGWVTCEASNGVGSSVTASAHLIVQYRARVKHMPATIYGGLSMTAILPCESEGEPPANTATWRKNGHVITTGNSKRIYLARDNSLQIHNLKHSDQGGYTCTPYNILGSMGESSQVQLIAKTPPRFTLRPQAEEEPEIGKPIRLVCAGRGDPSPTLSWRKVASSSHLPNKRVYWNRGNLTITSVMKRDHGSWQCVLTSPVAELVSNVQINVKYTTPHTATNVTVLTSSDSATISWLAGYDGGYPQHFMIWFKRADQGDHAWRTRSVNQSHTVAVVNRLLPETVYQFAVLPANVLGSGKFSKTVTVKTKVKTTEAPSLQRNDVPPPSGLTFTINHRNLIVLSWQTSDQLKSKNILGFLIEFRLESGNDVIAPSKAVKGRDARSVLGHLKSLQTKEKREISERDKVVILETYENEFNGNTWKVLDAYPRNTTEVEVSSEKLFQDTRYEFHVLTVTPLAYSAPSGSIFVSTEGLSSYLLPASGAIVDAAILSGVVAGTIFVALIMILGLGYCWCRCKSSRRNNETKRRESTSFLNYHKVNMGDSKRRPLGDSHSTDVTSQSVAGSKGTNDLDDVKIKKQRGGIFRRMMSKFDRSNSNVKQEKLLLSSRNDKTLLESERNESFSKRDPISQLEDDKFNLSLSCNSSSSEKSKPHNSTIQTTNTKAAPGCEIFKTRINNNIGDDRIPSGSYCNSNTKSIISTRSEEPNKEQPFDINMMREDGPSLEIDCSRSDIEVRYIAAEANSAACKTTSNLVRKNPSLSNKGASSSLSARWRFHHPSTTSYLSNSVRFPQRPATSASIMPPHLPTSEYIYLKDIGVPAPETSSSENTDPRCFSPAWLASNIEANLSTLKQHHQRMQGDHYYFSPRASYSGRKVESYSQQSTPLPNDVKYPESFKTHPSSSQLPITTSRKTPESQDELPADYHVQRQAKRDFPSTQRSHATSDPDVCTTKNFSYNKNNNGNRSFRSNSWSLPTKTHRKPSFLFEKRKDPGKRFASAEDMFNKSDSESEQRFSFTSGSASTVRCVASRDNNLHNESVEEESPLSNEVNGNLDDSQAVRVSLSPPVAPSDAGGGSCSGYESQNTASDTSSHLIKPSSSLGKETLRNEDWKKDDTEQTNSEDKDSGFLSHIDKKVNPHDSSRREKVRASTSSSEETRSRRDNSSVDDKYEWDSESAMESDVLEALKNLKRLDRPKSLSKNLLHELQQLNLDQSEALTPTLPNQSSNFAFNDWETGLESDGTISPSNDSYSKEKMEKRCAALKQEYMEYKRWMSSQIFSPSPSNT